VAGLVEEGDEGVPVLGLVVGAVDEDEVGFGHCCGVFLSFQSLFCSRGSLAVVMGSWSGTGSLLRQSRGM
jgi:hypothetical protein